MQHYIHLCFVLALVAGNAVVTNAGPTAHHARILTPLNERATVDHHEEGRIVGGTVATRGQFKYQALLMIDGSYLCGGTLIADNVVITSAACVARFTSFQVHLGAQLFYNTNEPGRQIITSTEVRVHEEYNSANFNNDIALIHLPTAAVTSEYVEPIALAQESDGDFAGVVATIAGWGTQIDGSFQISNDLRYNTVNIISNTECEEFYGPEVITSGVVCQSGADVGSPCNGDSGTGMVVDPEGSPLLVGISSFVSLSGLCEGTDPAGYIRVSNYVDWINTNSP